MLLLSPYVTLLCADVARGVLLHEPLWPEKEGSVALAVDMLTAPATPVALPGIPALTVAGDPAGRIVFVSRGEYDLCVQPARCEGFLRSRRDGRFAFLLVTDEEVAVLRCILAHRWDADGCLLTPCPTEDFALDFGRFALDLAQGIPVMQSGGNGRVVLRGGDMTPALHRAEPRKPEVLLRRRGASWQPQIVESSSALRETRNSKLRAAAEAEMFALPLTVSAADHAWMHDKPYGGYKPVVGRHRCEPFVVHESRQFVMHARHAEGGIFDEQDYSTEFGYITGFAEGGIHAGQRPPGMRSEGERLFIDRRVLDAAPVLDGPHIVFVNPLLANHYHWLIDSVLPLLLACEHAPEDARILIPATLQRGHKDCLDALGLSARTRKVDAPYVLAEDVYFVENGFIHNMPAAWVRQARDRIGRACLPAAQDQRVFIARRHMRRVGNMAQVEGFLAQHGFVTVELEDLSFSEQVRLFVRARWVVGVHGAGLANLLFCQPGTKVLELSPDPEYRPFFAYLSGKLGLDHAVLPCAAAGDHFNGDLQVDMAKFTALFRMLRHRLRDPA